MPRRSARRKRPAQSDAEEDETETVPLEEVPITTTTMATATALSRPLRPQPSSSSTAAALTLLDLPLDAWSAILEAGGSCLLEDDEDEDEFPISAPPNGGLQPADLACLSLSCKALGALFSSKEGEEEGSSSPCLASSHLALRASQRAAAWLLSPRLKKEPSEPISLRCSTVKSLWLDLVDDDAAALLGAALVSRRRNDESGNGDDSSFFAPAAPLLESLDLCVAQLPSLRAAADSQAAGAPPPVLDVAAFVPRIDEDTSRGGGAKGGFKGLRHLGVHGAAACLRSAASASAPSGNRLRNLVSLSLDTAHSGAVWNPFYRGWDAVAALGLAAAEGAGEEGEEEEKEDEEENDEDGKQKQKPAKKRDETLLAATPSLRSLALRLHPSPCDSWRGVSAARLPAATLTSLTLVVSTPLRDDLGLPLRDIAAVFRSLKRLRVVNRGGGAPRVLLLPPDDNDEGNGEAEEGGGGNVGAGLQFARTAAAAAAGKEEEGLLSLSIEVTRSPLLEARRDGEPGFPSPATATALARSRNRNGSNSKSNGNSSASVVLPPQVSSSRGALSSLVALSVGSGTAPRELQTTTGGSSPSRLAVADLSVLSGAPRLARLELRDFGLVRGLGKKATPRLRSLSVKVSARYTSFSLPLPPTFVVVEWPCGAAGGEKGEEEEEEEEMPLLRSLVVACGGGAGPGGVRFRLRAKDDADTGDERKTAAAVAAPAADAAAARGTALGARLRRLCLVAGGGEEDPYSPSPPWWGDPFLTAAAREFSRQRSRGESGSGSGSAERLLRPAHNEGESAATLFGHECIWPVRVLASEESLLGPAGSSGAALRSLSLISGGAPRRLLRLVFGRDGGNGLGAAFAALGPLPPAAL